MEQARQYRLGDSNVDAFDKNTAEHRVARGKLRRSAQTDLCHEDSVPLFISDSDGEPDPSEYITSLLKKRRASISSRILAGVCAAAAVATLVALFSSNATRDTVRQGPGRPAIGSPKLALLGCISRSAPAAPARPATRACARFRRSAPTACRRID